MFRIKKLKDLKRLFKTKSITGIIMFVAGALIEGVLVGMGEDLYKKILEAGGYSAA